jgi:hypothetical protein
MGTQDDEKQYKIFNLRAEVRISWCAAILVVELWNEFRDMVHRKPKSHKSDA